MDKKRLTIFMTDSIPGGNKGEEAILRGLLKTLKKYFGEIEFYLFSRNVQTDKKVYGNSVGIVAHTQARYPKEHKLLWLFWMISCRVFGRRLVGFTKSEVLRAYLKSNLILYGHDNLLSSPLIDLSLLFEIIVLNKIARKPVAICAGSFGPLKNRWQRLLGKILLDNTNIILLRDPMSYKYALKLSRRNERIHLVSDLAFLLDPETSGSAKAILDRHGIPEDGPIIGLTVAAKSVVTSNACISTEEAVDLRAARHAEIIAYCVSFLQSKYNVSIIFLPHCVESERDNDDRFLARQIYNLLPLKEYVWVIEEEYSAAELKAIIGKMDLLIGERTHSVIASAGMFVPFVCISLPEDFRSYGIIGTMLGQENGLYDIRKLDKRTLCHLVETRWKQRNEIKKELRNIIPMIIDGAHKTGELLSDLVR